MCKKSICFVSCFLILGLAGIAPADLVSQWKLDEGSGKTAFDSGPGGNDGTLFGDTDWTTGVSGTALEFFGLGGSGSPKDYVNCGSGASLDITTNISIALWIKPGADDPEGKATTTAPMAKADMNQSNSWSWQVRYGWGGAPKAFMSFTFNSSPRAWAFVGGKLTRDEWVHIACSHDGATLKCYVNGEQTDSTAMGAFNSSPTPVLIGSDGWGCDWIGAIDDVRIYNHCLTDDEIAATMSTEPVMTAGGPTPRDGSMIDKKLTILKWRAGDSAVTHEVYFGEDFAKVSAATPADTDVFVGRQSAATLNVGMPGGPCPTGLVPGKTYYWRVDEINESNPDSPWKGPIWSFQVQPLTAWKPYPADGMKYVDPDQDLSWQKGMGVLFHQIYFGDDFEKVSTMPAGGWMSVTAAYDPGTLQLDKTYYWRIDEFAGAVTTKGPVWSFTTRGSGGGVKAQYFTGMQLAGDPVLTQTEGSIDHQWATEVAAGLADGVSARWTANLQVPFTESYRLITTSDDGVRLWLDGRLVIDNWTDHGTTDNTATANLIAGQNYGIRMEYYENTGGAVAQLSWESASLPRQIIPQGWLQLPLWATSPSPAHNATNTPQELTLQWLAGDEATHQDVYFGDSAEAVAQADSSTTGIYQGRQAVQENTFDPGPLDWNKTYYWRVDEINTANAASPWKGSVWSFTTADFIVVEDFESYTDEEGSEIFMTWIDGWADSSSGSRVGYLIPPYAEQKIFHGGRQSMPLDYNNVASPYYSEAQRTWDTPQNWTLKGADTLVLFIRGNARNQAAPLYVVVEDTAGHSGTATQTDTAVVTATTWTEWKIPLSSFTAAGVKANSIEKLTIGVGSRTSPAPGPAGLLYIDDIRVTKP